MSRNSTESIASAREIIRKSRYAVLASSFLPAQDEPLSGAGGAVPFSTLVQVGFDADGTPLMLLSRLAIHRRNLEREPAASLLFDGTAGMRERLAGPRITVIGGVEPRPEPTALERFVEQNPGAALYAGFADFDLFALVPVAAHFVSGFGDIRWVPLEEFMGPDGT